jgi:hypothetical protein
MLEGKSFSAHLHVLQRVITAMEKDPLHEGPMHYGVFFYGDFDRNPQHYGISEEQKRRLQVYATLRAAIAHFQYFDNNEDILAHVNAIKACEAFRPSSLSQEIRFAISDNDLNRQGFDPAAFDFLIRVIRLKALDVLEKQQEPNQEIEVLKMYLRDTLGIDENKDFNYKEEIIAMGFKPTSERFFTPILSLVAFILESMPDLNDKNAMERMRVFFQPPQFAHSDLYRKLVDFADDIANIPILDNGHIMPFNDASLETEVHPLFKRPNNLHVLVQDDSPFFLDESVINRIFKSKLFDGFKSLERLFEYCQENQIPLTRFGFKNKDITLLNELFHLHFKFQALHLNIDDREEVDPAHSFVEFWVKARPISDEIQDELEIPRHYGKELNRVYYLWVLEKIQSAVKTSEMPIRSHYSLGLQSGAILNLFNKFGLGFDQSKLNADDLTNHLPSEKFLEVLNRLTEIDFDKVYKDLEYDLTKGRPLDQLLRHFERYPFKETNPTVADFFPAMLNRVLVKNGLQSSAPLPSAP